jgi:hypothetical protein
MYDLFPRRDDLPCFFEWLFNNSAVVARIGFAVLPERIRMRLRSGDGRPLRRAFVNETEVEVLKKNTILLPAAIGGQFKIEGCSANEREGV